MTTDPAGLQNGKGELTSNGDLKNRNDNDQVSVNWADMQKGNYDLTINGDLKNRNDSDQVVMDRADTQNGNDVPIINGDLKNRNNSDQVGMDQAVMQNGNDDPTNNGDLKNRNNSVQVGVDQAVTQNGNDDPTSNGDLKNRNNSDQVVMDQAVTQNGNDDPTSNGDLKNRNDSVQVGVEPNREPPVIPKINGNTDVNAETAPNNCEILTKDVNKTVSGNDDISDSDTIEYTSNVDKHTNNTDGYSSSDSILYGFKRVNRSCKKIWMKKAQTVKVSVNVHRLSQDKIAQYTKNQAHSWDDIDPYSDAEVINSESENTVNDQDDSHDTNVHTTYSMRPRKREKPIGQTRTSKRKCRTKQTEMWYDDVSLPPSPKRKRKDYVGLKGPSSARIRSRNTQTIAPKRTIPLDYVTKETSSEGEETVDTLPDQAKKDDNIEHDNDTGKTPLVVKPAPKTLKGLFKKTTHGIKKHRRIRNYKCPKCDVCKNSQAEANEHYNNNHPPVSCSKCPKICATPCTLARHMYLHSELKYPCHRCEQRFAFESELKVHKYKHRRIRMFKCSDSGCSKSYFSEGELIQHAKVHDNIDHNCNYENCTYSSRDIRLLCSHECSHKDFYKFYCCICQKGFKYHTQWKRHTVQMKCTVPAPQN